MHQCLCSQHGRALPKNLNTMKSSQLLQTLVMQIQEIITKAEALRNLDDAMLTWRPNDTSWNILECLEHMNLYGDFYLPQIENKIRSTHTHADPIFKSGILGNYFAKSMLPKEKLNKMKTFKSKDPIHATLRRDVIDRFLGQQNHLITLLNLSSTVSLNKIKITTSVSSLLRFKLGETYRFYINHMIRHMQQIDNILLAMR